MKSWCAPRAPPARAGRGRWSNAPGQPRPRIYRRKLLHLDKHPWPLPPAINAAIKSQLDRVAHVSFLGSTNIPAIELAERLAGCFPPRTLTRIFYSDDGSTAVEVAVKMTLRYWQLETARRRRVSSLSKTHTTETRLAQRVWEALERLPAVSPQSTFRSSVSQISRPLSTLSADRVAAVIIEPLVQGAAGIRLWPPGMLKALRAWCDAHCVLLIFDEVLTAFGRTGRLFACEHERVLPDFSAWPRALQAAICRSQPR